jgi:hypothetical protein
MVSDTPACASDRLRRSGWRGPVVALLKRPMPRKLLRRVVGVEPPYGPPFLRVLAAVASREWFGWMPDFLPSVLALPGQITFRPDRWAEETTSALLEQQSFLEAMLPGTHELSGVYTYACKDARHNDFYYIFRYQAFWMRPASVALLQVRASTPTRHLYGCSGWLWRGAEDGEWLMRISLECTQCSA